MRQSLLLDDDPRWCLLAQDSTELRALRAHGVFTEVVRRRFTDAEDEKGWLGRCVRAPTWAVLASKLLPDRHPAWRSVKRCAEQQAAVLSAHLLGGDVRVLLDVLGESARRAGKEHDGDGA